MVSVTIDGAPILIEQGTEYIVDGTEEFDLGTLLIVNSTQRATYPDYANVVMTFNSETINACIKQDTSTRTSVGTTDKYEHRIRLAELVIKLSQYPHADRLYTTKSGAKTTYLVHEQEILTTANYGRINPITIATATQTALNNSVALGYDGADEKEYSGGDLLKTTVDVFRSLGLIPTLSLTNEIGHKDIRQQGSLVSFNRIDAEIITSDIADYAMKVYSKVKSGTYEANLITGGTFYPSVSSGVTVRTSKTKYTDDDAEYLIDSGIRRMIDVRGKNITTSSIGTLTNLLIKIVSKPEWDDLEINREYANATPSLSVYYDDYKNNTPYFIEGDNVIYNVGTQYDYNGILIGQPKDVLNQAIRKAIFASGESETEFVTQTIKDVELVFFYQPIRDMDVVQERHDLERVSKISTIINQQKDSKLELARFGNANKQLINRIGNDTYQITVRYFDKNTPTYFQVGDYTDDGYRIIKRQFLLRDSSQDVTYLLTKNQSILNPTTSVKRNFTSPFTVSKRNILTNFVYEQYIEFSGTNKTDVTTDQNMKEILLNAFDFDAAYNKPIYNCQYRRGAGDYINMSVKSFPMGNSFEFNAQFKHPKFAGYQLVSDAVGNKITPVSYTDANGEIDTARFYFMNTSVINPDLHPVGTFNTNWAMEIPLEDINLNPDEILGMTYAKHCVTDNSNLFVGDYFLQNNSLIKELGGAASILVVYYPTNPRYTIYDQYAKTGATGTGTFTVGPSSNFILLSGIPAGYSWAIVEAASPNRLYFAYNNTGTNLSVIYLNLLNDRPNTETL